MIPRTAWTCSEVLTVCASWTAAPARCSPGHSPWSNPPSSSRRFGDWRVLFRRLLQVHSSHFQSSRLRSQCQCQPSAPSREPTLVPWRTARDTLQQMACLLLWCRAFCSSGSGSRCKTVLSVATPCIHRDQSCLRWFRSHSSDGSWVTCRCNWECFSSSNWPSRSRCPRRRSSRRSRTLGTSSSALQCCVPDLRHFRCANCHSHQQLAC